MELSQATGSIKDHHNDLLHLVNELAETQKNFRKKDSLRNLQKTVDDYNITIKKGKQFIRIATPLVNTPSAFPLSHKGVNLRDVDKVLGSSQPDDLQCKSSAELEQMAKDGHNLGLMLHPDV